MAVKKMSSQEMNAMMHKTQETLKNMDQSISLLKEDMQSKMRILSTNAEYASQVMEDIYTQLNRSEVEGNTVSGLKNKTAFGINPEIKGLFDSYGSTIHPAFIKAPVNTLNAYTGSSWIYRPTAEVKINGEVKNKNQHILMHDQVAGKSFSLEEYESPYLTLEITVDRGLIMGPMDFNVLEISPFLAGSFDIRHMKVYDIYPEEEDMPDYEARDIMNVGASRIILDKKYALSKIEMSIELHYRNEQGRYPFGLKHLYFLNADFKSGSHVIIPHECSGFVNTVGENVFIHDIFKRRASTASEEGIKFYLELTDGVTPEYEFQTSTYEGQWPLIRNTRNFYVYVPLKDSLQSVEITDVSLR